MYVCLNLHPISDAKWHNNTLPWMSDWITHLFTSDTSCNSAKLSFFSEYLHDTVLFNSIEMSCDKTSHDYITGYFNAIEKFCMLVAINVSKNYMT